MDFDLAPPTGVGPLRIGMTRHAANEALDSLRDLSAISESDRPGQHVFRPSGLMISIHCMRDVLKAIELGRPSYQTDRVLFQGVDVFALPAREVVRCVGEFTSIEEDPDDDASFIAPIHTHAAIQHECESNLFGRWRGGLSHGRQNMEWKRDYGGARGQAGCVVRRLSELAAVRTGRTGGSAGVLPSSLPC